jgi:Flp pilus assembly protein TadG
MQTLMLKKFAGDRRATIALITAIFIFPLMFLGVGVPIDLARAIQYRASLQNIADGAALAGSEALGAGATPLQACNLTLAYANLPINNGELLATATPTATLTSLGPTPGLPGNTTTSYPCSGASTSPVITQADAPNQVSVSISGSQPTTFLSIYKPSIPVTVASSAIGPQGFITINVTPNKNYSGDLSQAYYYLRNPNGSLTNEAGTAVATSSAGLFPTTNGVVSLSAFLGDDKYYPTCNGPTVSSPCGTQVSILVKTGLAQRLGFAYYVVANGQGPCTAVYPSINADLTNFTCLQSKQNYPLYNPYYQDTNIYNPDATSDDKMSFYDYYHAPGAIAVDPNDKINPKQPYLLVPNAYGSPIGWVDAFFSTDYPASLNTNNYFKNTMGVIESPTAGDSCFTNVGGAPVVNGYAANTPSTTNPSILIPVQSCIIQESSKTTNSALTAIYDKNFVTNTPLTPFDVSGGKNTTVAFWSSWSDPTNGLQSLNTSLMLNPKVSTRESTSYPADTDLACLVHGGVADTPTITNTGKYSSATGINAGDQQENLAIATTSTAPGSYGTNVFACPVDTVGNPYYPDPTCAELNGATLLVGWNDMGGNLYDNGNYVDLHYSYSCQPPSAQDTINSAIIQ